MSQPRGIEVRIGDDLMVDEVNNLDEGDIPPGEHRFYRADLLRECLKVLNHIPNTPYPGAHKTTYALANAIEKELKP